MDVSPIDKHCVWKLWGWDVILNIHDFYVRFRIRVEHLGKDSFRMIAIFS